MGVAAAGAATATFFLGGASESSESDSESSEELESALLGFAAALGPLPLTTGVAAFFGLSSSSSGRKQKGFCYSFMDLVATTGHVTAIALSIWVR